MRASGATCKGGDDDPTPDEQEPHLCWEGVSLGLSSPLRLWNIKQIDDLSQLEDNGLLVFEIIFASVFLLLVIFRYTYMRRFETFQGSTVPVHRYHKRFARTMHVAMYLCLALLPLTGLAIAALYTQGLDWGWPWMLRLAYTASPLT